MSKKIMDKLFKKCVTFSELSLSQEGGNESIVQILRTGSWDHPTYGSFSITTFDLDEFIANFNAKVRGMDICVDENHDYEHKAVGWYRELYREGEALFARIEWNEKGLELINSKTYKYFSPELFFSYRDEESGVQYKNVLIGWGITNRPFFKGMKALTMSEPNTEIDEKNRKQFYFFNKDTMKKKFSELAEEIKNLDKIDASQLDEARLAFSELSEDEQKTNGAVFNEIAAKFSEEDAGAEDEAAKQAQADADADAKAIADKEVEDKRLADEAAAAEAAKAAKAAWEGTGEWEGEGEGAEFNEKDADAKIFKETGLTMAQIKDMQKQFNEMAAAKKFSETKEKVSAFVFGESNKTGSILPRAKDAVVAFANKLPDTLQAEFFEILKAKSFSVVDLTEKGATGADADTKQFSVPSETPAGVTRESFVLATIAKQFSEKEGLSLMEATLKASKYVAENKLV